MAVSTLMPIRGVWVGLAGTAPTLSPWGMGADWREEV